MSRAGARAVAADLSQRDFEFQARLCGFVYEDGCWFADVRGRWCRFRSFAPSRRQRLREMLESRARLGGWLSDKGVRHA